MLLIIWSCNFIKAQGIPVTDCVVYQDNQSAILLEKKGQASSGKRTQHINIWYFLLDFSVVSTLGTNVHEMRVQIIQ